MDHDQGINNVSPILACVVFHRLSNSRTWGLQIQTLPTLDNVIYQRIPWLRVSLRTGLSSCLHWCQMFSGWMSIMYNDTNRRGLEADNLYCYYHPYHNHMLDGTSFITATPTEEHVAHLPQPLLQPLGLHIARLSPWTESRAMPCAARMRCVSGDDAVQGLGQVCDWKLWKVTGGTGMLTLRGWFLSCHVVVPFGKSSRRGTGGGVAWYTGCRWGWRWG